MQEEEESELNLSSSGVLRLECGVNEWYVAEEEECWSQVK